MDVFDIIGIFNYNNNFFIMVITTKYNIGDKVFIIHNNEIIKVPITHVETYNSNIITYTLLLSKALSMMDKDRIEKRSEINCFQSIEELVLYYKKETNDI